MKEFFDTSVLVAAFRGGHVHHVPSLKRFAAAEKRIPPEQALLFVEEVRNRLTLVSLNTEEYFAAIQNTASRGFIGGRIYDSLLLACAAKCKAQAVYTWNLKHYQSLAPDLAPRIQTP